jgi:hypothetical protein
MYGVDFFFFGGGGRANIILPYPFFVCRTVWRADIGADASYQVSVHMAISSFKGEDVLEIDQSETRIACGFHVC